MTLIIAYLFKVFETVDIENTNEGAHPGQDILGGQTSVDGLYQPVEKTRVDEFGNRVLNHRSLLLGEI